MTDDVGLRTRLAVHPFVAGLEPGFVDALAGMARFVDHPAGAWVALHGHPADAFYLVVAGRCAIEVGAAGRAPLVIATVHPGEVLGWSWMFPPHRWHFDVLALDPVRTIAVKAAALLAACDANHEFGYEITRRLAAVIATRLESTELQLIDVYGHAR